jgi:hypothetical protein
MAIELPLLMIWNAGRPEKTPAPEMPPFRHPEPVSSSG